MYGLFVLAGKKRRASWAPVRYACGVSDARQFQNLALIGFMGTGKSSGGQLVANALQFKFVDTDALIEERAGRTISNIFAQAGEEIFRNFERQVVIELCNRTQLVIAAGGGLVTNETNFASLKTHARVVCLWAGPDTIWERVRHQTHRPLLLGPDPQTRIRHLLEQREPFYRQADVLVNTELRSSREVAQQVLHRFHLARSGQPGM